MYKASKQIFIVGAKRTPFGAFGGSLKHLSATDLCVHSSKAAIAHANIDPSKVDSVFVGNVIQTGLDAAYLSRHVGLRCGLLEKTPCLTINRLCGSGFETVINGAEAIELGYSKISLCGGSENMSAAPLVVDGNKARWGVGLGQGLQMEDLLWKGLTDALAGLPMGMTAENLGEKFGITREECDNYAYQSQQRWKVAHDNGIFKNEIAPIEVEVKRKGLVTIDADESPRPDTSLEKISKLPTVFKKNGLVSPGNASGISDGAGSILIASEDAVSENNLLPLAKVVAWNRVGCDPSIMGIGPVEAMKGALSIANLSMDDMDLIEINEAFAPQFLACAKELNLDMEKTNLNGGAIALGHPLGASGSRIVAHLTHELQRTQKKYAIGSACIGGGQGIAVIIERC